MMKKGISTIIAAIILVVITIGLIGTAYMYFSGIVSVGPVLALASGYCNTTNHIHITIRNDGTAAFATTDLSVLQDGTAKTVTWEPVGSIDPGSTTTGVYLSSPGLKNVLIVGPRNQINGPITC